MPNTKLWNNNNNNKITQIFAPTQDIILIEHQKRTVPLGADY